MIEGESLDHAQGSRHSPDDLPRSPTGRIPQWVIDEAAGRAPDPSEVWRAGPSVLGGNVRRPASRGAGVRRSRVLRRRRRAAIDQPYAGRTPRGSGLAAILVVVLVTALWVVQAGGPSRALVALGVTRPTGTGLPDPAAPAVDGGQLPASPTPGREESSSPLGQPAQLVATSTSYGYEQLQADGVTPVAYDPCRPIHYVTRPDGAPADGPQLVADAVAQISLATGLQFIDDGPTEEAPSETRALFQPELYGDRWVPVLVSWSTPDEAPRLQDDVVGFGGSAYVSRDGSPAFYVTGQVTLDAAKLSDTLAEPNGTATARAVVMHELSHVVGLSHVDDTAQVMYPQARRSVTELGAGDLTGLATLGRGACAPDL